MLTRMCEYAKSSEFTAWLVITLPTGDRHTGDYIDYKHSCVTLAKTVVRSTFFGADALLLSVWL